MFKTEGGSLDIATRYTIDAIENDEVVQHVETHNIFLDRFLTGNTDVGRLDSLYMRLGSGNTAPVATQTGLATPLWNNASFAVDAVGGRTCVTSGTNDIILTLKYTIPATQEYVGSIAELGLLNYQYNGNACITRALVLDAEGLPIVINKTDLTIIKITVELKFTLTPAAGFTMIPIERSGLFLVLSNNDKLKNDGGIFSVLRGSLLFHFSPKYAESYGLVSGYIGDKDLNAAEHDCSSTRGLSSRKCVDTFTSMASRQNVYSGYRLGNTYYPGKHSFVRGLMLNRHFILKFPNADFFPDYAVTGIAVGIGDGTKTDFEPPLEYWKANTEIIYVNGVAQVRNVDYTCDSHNNRNRLPELFESNDGAWTGGDSADTLLRRNSDDCYTNIGACITNQPYILNYRATAGNYYQVPRGIYQYTQDKPVYCDLGASKPINFAYFGYFRSYAYTSYLEYSSTGNPDVPEDWTVAASITHTEVSSGVTMKTFTAVSARYWRYRAVTTQSDTAISTLLSRYAVSEVVRTDSMKLYCVGFGFQGDPIKFVTAPAVDAVITMDVTMDLPLASDNRVVDVSATMTI